MGQTTPNIGIYIPAAGETNYDQAFAAGMVNTDQHDHSGGPNKGLPIATEGLADFSVTFNKLNANVVDQTTGIGVSGAFPNQLVMLDPLKSIFQQAPASGFITMDGTDSHIRTFQNSASVTWTNGDGVGGDPSASVNIAGISPVTVPNGGTGLTSLTPYAVMAGGTTGTGNVQQVSGVGTAGQSLVSQGAGALPVWSNNFVQVTKPAFRGVVNLDITSGTTGNGAVYKITYQTESFDQANNFTPGATSTFTAPSTAIYWLNVNLILQITSSNVVTLELDFYVNGAFNAANTPFYIDPNDVVDASGFFNMSFGQLIKLTAGDTVDTRITATGGSNNDRVSILIGTAFTGFLAS